MCIRDREKGEEENVLPAFVKGESGPHVPDLYAKWTQPPRPYTEMCIRDRLNAEYIETLLKDICAECVELNFSTCQGHVVELAELLVAYLDVYKRQGQYHFGNGSCPTSSAHDGYLTG